jgi:hypothetical protein
VVGKVLAQYFIRTVESGLPTLSTPLNYSPACPSLLAVNRGSEVLFRLRSAKEGGGYLKFDNRCGKIIRSSQRNEGGIKKGEETKWGKSGKEMGNEEKENLKEECILFFIVY